MRIKRGLSPVVATALLITIAIILAAILFFWARGLLTERNQKFGEAIENSCDDVSFKAEAFANDLKSQLVIVNRGNVPLYAVDVRAENAGAGTVQFVNTFRDTASGTPVTIPLGSTAKIEVDKEINPEKAFGQGDTLVLKPVLLGSEGGKSKVYVCETQAVRINVGT
jgi:flagellin-like protein